MIVGFESLLPLRLNLCLILILCAGLRFVFLIEYSCAKRSIISNEYLHTISPNFQKFPLYARKNVQLATLQHPQTLNSEIFTIASSLHFCSMRNACERFFPLQHHPSSNAKQGGNSADLYHQPGCHASLVFQQFHLHSTLLPGSRTKKPYSSLVLPDQEQDRESAFKPTAKFLARAWSSDSRPIIVSSATIPAAARIPAWRIPPPSIFRRRCAFTDIFLRATQHRPNRRTQPFAQTECNRIRLGPANSFALIS